ncbi:MAG: hypothetical protein H6927_12065 [Burkholderiaceae bacterium]|nr:hypothetical protein [Burkholderiaceae bacterium]MCP5218831.1 hypothetical protein [Burkholderiaceae bacterium]
MISLRAHKAAALPGCHPRWLDPQILEFARIFGRMVSRPQKSAYSSGFIAKLSRLIENPHN